MAASTDPNAEVAKFRDTWWNLKRGLLTATVSAGGVALTVPGGYRALIGGNLHAPLSGPVEIALAASASLAFLAPVTLYLRSQVTVRTKEIVSQGAIRCQTVAPSDIVALTPRRVYNGASCVCVQTERRRVRIPALPWEQRDRLYPVLPPQFRSAGIDRRVRRRFHEWWVSSRHTIGDGNGWRVYACHDLSLRKPVFERNGMTEEEATHLVEHLVGLLHRGESLPLE